MLLLEEINKVEIIGNTAKCISGKVDELPEILDYNDIVKSIDLYPFEQCEELTLQDLGFKKKYLKKSSRKTNNYENTIIYNVSPIIQIQLDHNDDEAIHYTIIKNKKYFSFVDYSLCYDEGDACTNVYNYDYKGESYSIIENVGDVSSVLVFKF